MTRATGRPRSADIDSAVKQAVVTVLAERGYPGVTIEGVAARAGVAKTAIYRRWASKPEMVFAALVHDTDIRAAPDQGSYAGDLRALTARIIELLSEPVTREALPGLLADLRATPALAARFRDLLIAPERRIVEAILHRARARGDLPAGADPVVLHAHLLGAVFAWIYLIDAPMTTDLATRIAQPLIPATEK